MRNFHIVGAGLGDPDLLTISAVRALESADVVYKDNLVSSEIINRYCQNKTVIEVGRKHGEHMRTSIDAIREHISLYGHQFETGVHLKSGDPGIFSRLHEEIEMFRSLGIVADIIPGISSAVGLPTIYGIPLTLRGYSSSVSIVSASDTNGNFNVTSIRNSLGYSDTSVFLMGSRYYNQILKEIENMRCSGTIAVIENGTNHGEKHVIFSSESIPENYTPVSPSVIIFLKNVPFQKLDSILIDQKEDR